VAASAPRASLAFGARKGRAPLRPAGRDGCVEECGTRSNPSESLAMEADEVRRPHASPLRLRGTLDPGLSRWLWLVKWLLAIPHYIVLFFLWLAFFVLTVVAFFAILVTGRYPRGIFEFNVGVLRWTWRVAFYSYGALGSDRYPPFTLDDAPDYPATLELAYEERLSRGLVLVKWWLLAIPHYVVVGVFLGGGGYAAAEAADWVWAVGLQAGLIGTLVLFAAVALLFTTRYPPGIFDFVLGLDRWVARVAVYVGLMTDSYPPFRLDQGGEDAAAVMEEAPLPPAEPAAVAPTPLEPAREGGGSGRVVLIVVGSIAAVLAFCLLAGGCALIAVDQIQRDDDGFLMSPSEDFRTPTHAIVSESADVDTDGAEWALDAFLGTVRIRSETNRPVFVGIGAETEVNDYLAGVEHDVVTDFEDEPQYSRTQGGEPENPPEDEEFWAATSSGSGEQTLEWDPENGDWRVVVMNADGSRGVSSEMSIGAELDSVIWIGIGLLAGGALLAGAAALAITAGVRRGRRSGVGSAAEPG
jgi:hypothetical protein